MSTIIRWALLFCMSAVCSMAQDSVTNYFVIPMRGERVPETSDSSRIGSRGAAYSPPKLINMMTSNIVHNVVVGERVGDDSPPFFVSLVSWDNVMVTNADGKKLQIPVAEGAMANLQRISVILRVDASRRGRAAGAMMPSMTNDVRASAGGQPGANRVFGNGSHPNP